MTLLPNRIFWFSCAVFRRKYRARKMSRVCRGIHRPLYNCRQLLGAYRFAFPLTKCDVTRYSGVFNVDSESSIDISEEKRKWSRCLNDAHCQEIGFAFAFPSQVEQRNNVVSCSLAAKIRSKRLFPPPKCSLNKFRTNSHVAIRNNMVIFKPDAEITIYLTICGEILGVFGLFVQMCWN
jgi:hypothetical protein